jgi:hypothetical protein
MKSGNIRCWQKRPAIGRQVAQQESERIAVDIAKLPELLGKM